MFFRMPLMSWSLIKKTAVGAVKRRMYNWMYTLDELGKNEKMMFLEAFSIQRLLMNFLEGWVHSLLFVPCKN